MAIKEHGFVASPFPVIITLENHTDAENQVMFGWIGGGFIFSLPIFCNTPGHTASGRSLWSAFSRRSWARPSSFRRQGSRQNGCHRRRSEGSL